MAPLMTGHARAHLQPCIEATGSLNAHGYGHIRHEGKVVRAHRLAYAKANGLTLEDIAGQVVRHTCDNPACINVEHLEPGTQQDNADDKVKRGRSLRGEAVAGAKLTADMVASIKAAYVPRSRHANQYQLAQRFGVSQSEISHILSGKRWSYT